MGRTSDSRQRLMGAAHELIWGFSYGSVTIEAICARAGVKKGSFYYFFESKSALAIAAISAYRAERVNTVMSFFQPPSQAALEPVWKYLDHVSQEQLEAYEQNGQVLGCPLFTLGSEICTQDEKLRTVILELLTSGAKFFEDCLRDAALRGEIDGEHLDLKARLLWAFYEGTLTRARIENNPELVRNLCADALVLIGARRCTQPLIVAEVA